MSADLKVNVEIKARCADPENVRSRLTSAGARYVGLDRQKDTYFRVAEGRLKLREGSIEKALIFYRRSDEAGPRPSFVRLYRPPETESLRELLVAALHVEVIVEKARHIYFLENVKVHVDTVEGLGHFLEIEAIGDPGEGVEPALRQQCRQMMALLEVADDQLVDRSYSDLILDALRR